MTPRVSVMVPAYNGGDFLAKAIDSVLEQSLEDFELVVSDDASDDGSIEACRAISDSRLRIESAEERLGQAGNWNRCVELASAPYVVLLHADDELAPEYLERAVAVLDANRDVGLVHCAVQHIDEEGRALHTQQLFEHDQVDRSGLVLRRLLLDGCVINPAGVMVRREAFLSAGRFSDAIVWGVDWDMWMRVASQWPTAYLSEQLARYRQHEQSGTATAVMNTGRNTEDEMWVLGHVFDLTQRSHPELAPLRRDAVKGVAHRTWCFAESNCERGQMDAARAGLRNAVRTWPAMVFQPRVWALWVATHTGYDKFARTHGGKQWLGRQLRRFP